MRIALVDPALPNRSRTVYAGYNVLEPLGLQYIGGTAKAQGHDVRIFSEGALGSGMLDEIATFDPQLTGISCLTCNAAHVFSLARQIKAVSASLVAVGGYHASGAPEELVRCKDVDFVVVGEGEMTLAKIAQSISSMGRRSEGDKIIRAPHVQTFDDLSWPLRDGHLLSRCRLLGVMDPSPSKQKRVASVLASRGCPNSCSYCAASSVWGNRNVLLRPEDDLHSELAYLQEEMCVDTVFLSDLTLNCSAAHVRSVCRAFSRLKKILPWYCMCQVKLLGPELLAPMASAGCRKIGLGLETPLWQHRGRLKGDTEDIDHLLGQIIEDAHAQGIFVKGYLMVGYPWETQETLTATRDALMRHAFDEIKVSFYTPFPGTRDFDRWRDCLTTSDWSDYDTVSTPVVRMQGVTAAELIEWRTDLFRSYYGSHAYRALLSTWRRRGSHFISGFSDMLGEVGRTVGLTIDGEAIA